MRITASQIAENEANESQRIYNVLQQHLQAKTAMENQFREADEECRVLAGEVAAARLAQSPTAAALHAELVTKRYSRDFIRDRWLQEKQTLENQLERLTRPVVTEFLEWCVATLRNLGQSRKIADRDLYTEKGARIGVRVTHNLEAITRVKDRIMAAMNEARMALYLPLREIRTELEKIKGEIADIDLSECTVKDTVDSVLADMREKPELKNLTSAVKYGKGPVVPVGVSMSEHVDMAIAQMEK